MQSPSYQAEAGAFRVRANVIGFGIFVTCFMLLFSAFSVFACYKAIHGKESIGIILLSIFLVTIGIFLVVRVIPACIRHSKAELIGKLQMEADDHELRIIKEGEDIQHILWKDFKGAGIGSYYIGCQAIVVQGRKMIAFGITLSPESKSEICEWIIKAFPNKNENGA